MERRQRWLENQFRRQDECLSKIAKQLQVLQDFISLNFDSYRQYALERERVDGVRDLSYLDKQSPPDHTQQQHQISHHHGYHQVSPLAHSQYQGSRLTPLPAPDHFSSSSRVAHPPSNNLNSESDYDDGDTMDPAPGESDPSPNANMPHSVYAVDLSTERRRYHNQSQEPNSTTITGDYAAYYGHGLNSGGGVGEEITLPDSALLDEGPTDLSTTEKKSGDECSPPGSYQVAQGSILGGILTSHMQQKIKTEVKDEEDATNCYVGFPRSRTASTEDSTSKDKEYSSQALWSAGTVTTVSLSGSGGGGGPGSTCSTDETEQLLTIPQRPAKGKKGRKSVKDVNNPDYQHFILASEGHDKGGKLTSSSSGGQSPGNYHQPHHRKRKSKVVVVEDGSGTGTPSSTAGVPHRSPSTSTTSSSTADNSTATTSTTSGRKGGNSSSSNASKQCRYCGKTFQWLHSVKTHERLHTGIKPYACKICGARFTQNGNLKVHAKTCVEKHADSYRSRNVLICSVCTEMFSDSDALMEHQKSHDRMQWTIKEKTCQLCGEVFQKRSFLLEHEKVHVQDRSFLTSLGIEAETGGSGGEGGGSAPTAGSVAAGNNNVTGVSGPAISGPGSCISEK